MAGEEALLAASMGLAQTAGNVASAQQSNRWQLKLAKYQYEQEREMIKEQNEYNSPKNQMARYLEAGLNPNLIYGEGKASAGNQPEIARYQAPTLKVPDLGNVIQSALQFAMARKDLALKEQELRNKKEEQFNLRSVRNGIDLDNVEKSILLDYNPGIVLDIADKDKILGSKKLKNYDLGIQAKEAEIAYTNARKELSKVNTKYQQNIIDKFQEKELELLNAQIEGKNIDNQIQEIERDLQKNLSSLGGRTGVKIIIDLLRAIFK